MDDAPPFADRFDDPRVTPEFCRRVPGADGDVILLGVVHDHPASVGRVGTVLDRVDPAVLAVELPSAAVPLYRTYARETDDAGRPRFGGEMSAAIAAAGDAEVVGIDAPSWSFCRRLATRLVADRVAGATARRLLSSLGGATRTALSCRLAATLTNATSMTVAADDPISYDCSHADPPTRQAAHERSHVAGVRALLRSGEPGAVTYRDETREACMVDRLRALRERGDVVVVVGVDHLEPLAEALTGPEEAD
ncbi:hypothetical protein [Halovivax sp.]|uniref:hypothetical protein n=1 Tax=Halovivax sp. TaxID=1935978 RepID=UPI0025C402F2|nr:hypothetical protein [Halovivax sp.]